MKQVSLNEAAALCNSYGQPIPLMIDGKQPVYLLNEKLYNEYAQAKLVDDVLEGFDQIERGEYVDAATFEKEMHEKYGI